MKRWYLCDVVGDGVTPETAFRPAIADHIRGDYGEWCDAADPIDAPLGDARHVLVVVQSADHDRFATAAGCTMLVNLPRHARLTSPCATAAVRARRAARAAGDAPVVDADAPSAPPAVQARRALAAAGLAVPVREIDTVDDLVERIGAVLCPGVKTRAVGAQGAD